MHKKVILHFHKYIFYYIVFFPLFVIFVIFTICFIKDNYENKRKEHDYSYYNDTLLEIYRIDPTIFQFQNDTTAIIEVSDLLGDITNGKETIGFGEIPFTKEQDQCVGYIIAKKKENGFLFDYSHICDMVDY